MARSAFHTKIFREKRVVNNQSQKYKEWNLSLNTNSVKVLKNNATKFIHKNISEVANKQKISITWSESNFAVSQKIYAEYPPDTTNANKVHQYYNNETLTVWSIISR